MKAKPTYQELEDQLRKLEGRIEELETANRLLENIFNHIPIGLQVFDRDGFSQKVNLKQKELLGLPSLDEGIGRFNVLTDPYSKANGVDIVYQRAYRGEQISHEHEYNFDVPDNLWQTRHGKKYFQETIIPVFNAQHEVANVIAILSDITEKKETEQKLVQSEGNFRSFFNTITDFLFVLDQRGTIITANDTVYRRLGYSPEELEGQPVLIVHPEDRRAEAAQIVKQMLSGEAMFCPIPVVTKDGRLIPVETRVVKGSWNGAPAIFGVTKDISDLRLSEEKFSKLFQMNPAICAISETSSGEFIEVNNAFLEKLGFAYEEVIGRTAVSLGIFTEEARNDLLLRLDKDGRARRLESRLRTKNGKYVDVLLDAENIYIQDKLYRFTVAQDITQIKETERQLVESREALKAQNQELQDLNEEYSQITLTLQENLIQLQQAKDLTEENEAKFRALFNVSPDSLFIVEKGTGIIIDVNQKAIEQYGYTAEELIGQHNTVVSAEPEKTIEFADNPVDLLPIRYHRKKNGEVFPVEISTSSITIQGKECFFSTVRDITQRIRAEQILRESEQRFRSIFDNAIAGIAFSDANQNIMLTNSALDQMLGFEKGEMVGMNIDTLLQPGETPLTVEYITGQMLKGGYRVERPYLTKQKKPIWVDISASIIKGPDGKPQFFVGVVNDITEKKEAESRLKELVATKDRFISIIAHDLKSPFNAIVGLSELLRESVENKDYANAQYFSQVINASSHQALDLLINLLE